MENQPILESGDTLENAMLNAIKHWTPKLHDAKQSTRAGAELMITGIFVQYMLIDAERENLENVLSEIRQHDAYLEYQLGRLMNAWFCDVQVNGSLMGVNPNVESDN